MVDLFSACMHMKFFTPPKISKNLVTNITKFATEIGEKLVLKNTTWINFLGILREIK